MKPEDTPTDNEDNLEAESEATKKESDVTSELDSEQDEGIEIEDEKQVVDDKSESMEMEALQAEVADLNDKLLRALAETENLRRRAERDKADASKYAITNFAREMLAISDTLQRALESVDPNARKEHAVIEQLFVGLEMNEREIKNIFERFGIQNIKAMDEKFDHNIHEAMFELDDPSKPMGTVVQVVETGYMLKDRLLRPAKVGVSKGGPVLDKDDSDDVQASETKPQEDIPEKKTAYEGPGSETGAQLDEEL